MPDTARCFMCITDFLPYSLEGELCETRFVLFIAVSSGHKTVSHID